MTKKRESSHTPSMPNLPNTPNLCDPRALREALALFDLDDTDFALVRELRPALEREIDSLLESWLQQLLACEALHFPLADPELRKTVYQQNKRCLLTLGDPIDSTYLELRVALGRNAQQIGVVPAHCFAGSAFYATKLCDLAAQTFGATSEKTTRLQHTLTKLLFFDAQHIAQALIESREASLHEAQASLETRYQTQSKTLRETMQRAHAAEALASIAGLVSGLAHEIGTPMNVIQGHAELLELSAQNDKDRKRLQTIQTQVGRIAKIIQALLKMAHGEKEIAGPIDLQDAIQTSLGFLDEKFRKRGIRVVTQLSDTPTIEADPNRIRQLFLNLFLNAADAMPYGGELSVALAARDDQIEITIADNGIGIREQDLPRVFEPFFSTKEAGHGHGLGLVVAKEIVEDHAGKIEIESIEGDGTRLRILLPIFESSTKK